ncbi:MAG: hypothetical protein ACE5MM_08370 [Nitrospiraceae bacterium]
MYDRALSVKPRGYREPGHALDGLRNKADWISRVKPDLTGPLASLSKTVGSVVN